MRVVRSLLAAADVARFVAAAYDLGGPVTCRLFNLGDNDNYAVYAGGERYLLRLYTTAKHWPWGRSDRLFELEWLRFLASRGLPVVAPVPRADGALLGSVAAPEGERDIVLFPFVAGTPDPWTDDPLRLGRVGAALARLHVASDEFRSPHHRLAIDREFLVDGPLARAAAFLEVVGRQEELAVLHALADRARPALTALPCEAPAWGAIGGDCHGENHHFTAAGEPIFFDFDLCGHGWRAFDLAVPLWFNRRELGTQRALALFAPLLAGYERIRPLSCVERAALEPLVLARHLWLVGEHCADVETLGEARVAEAYWSRTLALLRRWLSEPLALPRAAGTEPAPQPAHGQS